MSKQDAIKEAWGEGYDSSIDENGWKSILGAFIPGKLEVDVSDCGKRYRPKSLQGIENNDGWIRIESEEDLPKDSHALLWVYTDHGNIYNYFFYSTWFSINELEKVVAYQPITKPLKPIY